MAGTIDRRDITAYARALEARITELERRHGTLLQSQIPTIGELKTYTPTWYAGSTVDNSSGLLVGRYFAAAPDLIFLNITMRLGAATVLPGGSWQFSMPPGLVAPANIYQNLHAWAYDASDGEFYRALSPIRENPGSWTDVVEVVEADDSFNAHNYSGLWYQSNRPFAWAVNDALCIHGSLIVQPTPP